MNQTIFDRILHHTESSPVDVHGLAKSLGVKVVEKPMPDGMSGSIEKKDGKFIVTINAAHHPNRQRFTLAHELGHFVFHGDLIEKKAINDDKLYRDNSRDDVNETQANKFAASILMPEKLIKKLINGGINTVPGLANELNVSEQAMRFRIQNLNLDGLVD